MWGEDGNDVRLIKLSKLWLYWGSRVSDSRYWDVAKRYTQPHGVVIPAWMGMRSVGRGIIAFVHGLSQNFCSLDRHPLHVRRRVFPTAL